jgi:predicted Zn-dependent peptidase
MRSARLRKRAPAPYDLSQLPNGLGIALKPMPQAASVSVGVWVRAGGRYEPAALSGISHLLEHLLFKGTRRRGCEQLKQHVEGVGGSLNGFTAEEFTCYMAKVPQRHAHRALDVLTDMVKQPRLMPRDTEKERDVVIEEIRMYEDTPGQLVHDLFNELLWPNHPLGMLLSGTEQSVRRITHAEVVRYWRAMYQPRNLLVTATGAFEPQRMRREIHQMLGRLRPRRASRFQAAPRARHRPQVRIWKRPTEQTHLCLGVYAVPRSHPDRFALELLHVLLGANMSSRLFREVREKRGLVYEIGSQIKRFHDTGAFVISAGCDAGKLHATVQTVVAELFRLRHQLVSRAELRRAKDYYAGQLVMGLEDTMDHMMWMGEQAVTVGRVAHADWLLQHLEQVQAADIRRVARRLFVDEAFQMAVVGPIEEAAAGGLAALCRLKGRA